MGAGGSKEKGGSASREEQPSPQPEKQGRPQSAQAGATFGRHRRSRSGTQKPTAAGSEAEAEAEEEPAEDMLEAEKSVAEEKSAHKAASKQQGLHCISDFHLLSRWRFLLHTCQTWTSASWRCYVIHGRLPCDQNKQSIVLVFVPMTSVLGAGASGRQAGGKAGGGKSRAKSAERPADVDTDPPVRPGQSR